MANSRQHNDNKWFLVYGNAYKLQEGIKQQDYFQINDFLIWLFHGNHTIFHPVDPSSIISILQLRLSVGLMLLIYPTESGLCSIQTSKWDISFNFQHKLVLDYSHFIVRKETKDDVQPQSTALSMKETNLKWWWTKTNPTVIFSWEKIRIWSV